MTYREYFAAHAPHVIPSWFKGTMPDKPKAVLPPSLTHIFGLTDPRLHQMIGEFHNRVLDSRVTDQIAVTMAAMTFGESKAEELKAASAAYEVDALAFQQNVRDHKAWESSKEETRVAQWPWKWATIVCAANGIRPTDEMTWHTDILR